MYEILLDSAVSAVYSEAAWLEIDDDAEDLHLTTTYNLDKEKIPDIKEATKVSKFKKILNSEFERSLKGQKLSAKILLLSL